MEKYKVQANLQFQQLKFEIMELKGQVSDQVRLYLIDRILTEEL